MCESYSFSFSFFWDVFLGLETGGEVSCLRDRWIVCALSLTADEQQAWAERHNPPHTNCGSDKKGQAAEYDRSMHSHVVANSEMWGDKGGRLISSVY